jgi:methylenetetrahydrofolate reductase (NADPH)
MKSGSRLEKLLAAGEFAVTAELGPPQNGNAEAIKKKARYFLGTVDGVNITDNQTAIVRMSSIAAGAIAISCGIEPVVQMVCRDRNRIAMQSDILGAAALGVKNILCLSGDHQTFGNQPQSMNVYDVDSMQLIAMVRKMRDDRQFLSGDPIKEHEPRLFIGAVANPFADPFEFRVVRLAKKVAAGADFIQTQCVFDIDKFARWMELVVKGGLHKQVYILAGLTPVRSAKALRYMKEEVAGMSVPDELIGRLEAAGNPKEEGIKICLEMIERIRDIKGVSGIHLMPIGWESITPVILERAGLLPRPQAGASSVQYDTVVQTHGTARQYVSKEHRQEEEIVETLHGCGEDSGSCLMEVRMEEMREEESGTGRRKVLFIDDDPDYVESVSSFLEKKYEVVTAFSAEEGWAEIEKEPPDLIVLDAMMEPKDGFTFAKELKEHPVHKDVPIVMLTGMVPQIPQTKYSQDQILRFEGDDFVEKSAGIEEILSTVGRLLQ